MSGVYDGRAGVETDVTKGKDGEGGLAWSLAATAFPLRLWFTG